MPGPDYAARRGRLVRSLKSADVDALLVSGETNVRYLTGFTGDSSWLYISRLNAVLISDSRYTTQISSECPALDVEIRSIGQTMSQATAQVVTADRPVVVCRTRCPAREIVQHQSPVAQKHVSDARSPF